MRKNVIFVVLVLVACLFSSCKKENGEYYVNANFQQRDVWTAESKLDTGGDTLIYMAMYVFDNNNDFTCFSARRMFDATDFAVTSNRITTTGHYNLYGVTGISRARLLRPTAGTALSTMVFTVDSLRDVCLGTQTVDITAANINYNVNITINHVMAQLSLAVNGVSTEIDSIKVVLPNQANQFDLNGVFYGNTTSSTITLVKSATPNTDGTYDFTCPETLIFPCASGTTSMPITVIAKQGNVETHTFNTSCSTCCTTGTRTALTTTWHTLNYNLTGGFSVNPWTSTIQTGTFTL